jgi:carboxypeptidase D
MFLSLISLVPVLIFATPFLPSCDASNYSVNSIPGLSFLGTTYAGLMPITPGNDTEYFFWYVPTDGGSQNDLVFALTMLLIQIMWFNGGPGCSSMVGALTEYGPAMFDYSSSQLPAENPYSWHKAADIVFGMVGRDD